MKQLTINPNNRQYYSEDFIKGFECGTQRQFEADKADRPQGKWIDRGDYAECSNCGAHSGTQFDGVEPVPRKTRYCHDCGAYMKGANTDIDCFDTCKHAYSEVCDECYKGNKYDAAERSR